jgi:hypothetical protein
MVKPCRMVVIAVPTVLCLAGIITAQQISGSMSGTVLDPQGKVMRNAKVALINQAQRVTAIEVTTSDEGVFVLTPLAPGA